MFLTHLDTDSTSCIIAHLDPASVYALGATCGQLSSLAHAHRADDPERFHTHWLAHLQRCIQEDDAACGYPLVTCFLRASHSRAASILGPAQRSLIMTLDQVLKATLRHQGEANPAPAEGVQELASACGLALASVGVSHLVGGVMSWMVQGLMDEEASWFQAWSDWADVCVDIDALFEASMPEHGSTITDAFVRATYGLY